MTAIFHRTPGLIDVRAFTTMGMSAKVSTNPIGMFGTGLKYAIAVLVRAGGEPRVWIGEELYQFYQQQTKFRDKDFQLVRMRRYKRRFLKPTYHDLPFTTEYGRNWKMWMAFRELEANTRDEGGETFLVDGLDEWKEPEGLAGHTTIVIDLPEYVECWEKRDEVFLPGGMTVRNGSSGLQILEQPSRIVYYRGMKAYEVGKPTFHTYNILDGVEITEDRTIKYEFEIKSALARHLLSTEDKELIKRVTTCDEKHWEHNLPFPEYMAPSETFRSVIHERPRGMWASAASYYTRYDTRPVRNVEDLYANHPRPWKVAGEDIVDANGTAVFSAPYRYKGRWAPLATDVVSKLGFSEDHTLEEEDHDEVEELLDPEGDDRAAHDAKIAEERTDEDDEIPF